ncbi:hypothetical protein [Variovorax sp. GB1P17]|uniref:hypothetical protein n=1 Tax=Variovorax sp. GB1P17 TaxID=3443740 RepID=UPI003F4729A1
MRDRFGAVKGHWGAPPLQVFSGFLASPIAFRVVPFFAVETALETFALETMDTCADTKALGYQQAWAVTEPQAH